MALSKSFLILECIFSRREEVFYNRENIEKKNNVTQCGCKKCGKMWKHNKSWKCVRVCLRVCQRMRLERRHETFRFYRYHFCLSSCMTNGTEERAGIHHQKGEQLTVFRKGIKLPISGCDELSTDQNQSLQHHITRPIKLHTLLPSLDSSGRVKLGLSTVFFFTANEDYGSFFLPNYHHAVSPFKTLMEIILKLMEMETDGAWKISRFNHRTTRVWPVKLGFNR